MTDVPTPVVVADAPAVHDALPDCVRSLRVHHERRDSLGRRIGYNWWREYIMSIYSPAREHWEVQFDLEANCTYRPGIIQREARKTRRGGVNEVTDFVSRNPPPTLRHFLEENAGMHDRQE